MDQGLRYCVRLRGELLRLCTGRARPLERAGQGLRPRAGRTTAPPAALTGQGLRQSVQLRGEPLRRRAGRAQPLRQGWWRPSASIATHCCKVHDIAAAARAHLYLSDQVFSLYQVNRPKNFEDSLETILYFTPGHEDIISVVRGIRKDGLSLF